MSSVPEQWIMAEAFWETICPFMPLFRIMFMISVVLLVLLALTIPYIESGSSAFYVNAMTFSVILVTLAGTGIVIRKCRALQK